MRTRDSYNGKVLILCLVFLLTSRGHFSLMAAQESGPGKIVSGKERVEFYGWPYVVGHSGLARDEVVFPDAGGFQVLKGDFHCHTIYSDGQVTPEVRVWEAWRDGLDILAITDHVEYAQVAVPNDRGRAYEKVKSLATQLGVTLLHSVELTTINSLTGSPGDSDYVASFINDEKPLDSSFPLAIESAHDQGAMIHWAHPGPEWAKDARDLLEKGWLDGIELRNTVTGGGRGTGEYRGATFYTQVIDWCLKNNLAVFAVSDAHWPIDQMIDKSKGERRDMTLILAKSRDPEGIREAIKQRRTVAYFAEMLWGQEKWLRAIAENAIETKQPFRLAGRKQNQYLLPIKNQSSFPFRVRLSVDGNLTSQKEFRLPSHATTLLSFSVKAEREKAASSMASFIVTNVLSGLDRPLEIKRELTLSK